MANVGVPAIQARAGRGATSAVDVLLWACRWNANRGGDNMVPCRLAGIDWDAVIDGATAHRIVPLLWAAMRDLPDVPAHTLNRVKELVKIQQFRALRRVALLLDLLALFEKHGIPVVTLKGSVLGKELYGHHWFRDSTDIDVLLREDDIDRAACLLTSWGYHDRTEHEYPRHRTLKRQSGCEVVLDNHDPTKARVELHWRLAPQRVACTIGVEEIWSRTRIVELMQRGVAALAPEDLLMYLCVHGSKHDWIQLYLLCDLVRMVETFPDLDWDHFMAISERASARRRAAVGLLLAHRVIGLSLPASVMEWISADRRASSMVNTIESYLLNGGSNWPAPWGTRFQHRSLETWRSRARYWHTELRLKIEPGEGIVEAFDLPDGLDGIYYVASAARLAGKAATRSAARVGAALGNAWERARKPT